ncbi:BnaUnng00780D [Brassica napus]|nr:unnamed protein product [Brassica napus]CDY62843.1 BnaUnng00780D [Brassica napus]
MEHNLRRDSSDPIPVDILIAIFSLVPGKSTARFRCVAKVWASILRLPEFKELFLTESFTRPRLFFAIDSYDDDKLFFYSTCSGVNLITPLIP